MRLLADSRAYLPLIDLSNLASAGAVIALAMLARRLERPKCLLRGGFRECPRTFITAGHVTA